MNYSKNYLPKSVAIIHSDVKREYFPTEEQFITEKDAIKDSKIISKYIEQLGIKTKLYPANSKLPELLRKDQPEVALNLVGSIKGNEYLASTIPGVLELLEIPYTGAGVLGEALSYNKFIVCKLLQQHGIPVPAFQLLNSAADFIDPSLRYPLISKLNEIHGAVEIGRDSVSDNEKHLRNRVKYLIETYNQPVLIQEFIVGEEITAFLLEGINKKVYCAKKIFSNSDDIYTLATFEAQWGGKNNSYTYEKYHGHNLQAYVKKAFYITKMADYGKFDIRLDQSGRYYFIDSNSNPAFGPKELDVAISTVLDLYGISFTEILIRLLTNTVREARN